MMPLVLFIFWIGIYPNTFMDKMNPSLENLISQVKGKQQVALLEEQQLNQSVTKITVNE